jgi:hypothetical protein
MVVVFSEKRKGMGSGLSVSQEKISTGKLRRDISLRSNHRQIKVRRLAEKCPALENYSQFLRSDSNRKREAVFMQIKFFFFFYPEGFCPLP